MRIAWNGRERTAMENRKTVAEVCEEMHRLARVTSQADRKRWE